MDVSEDLSVTCPHCGEEFAVSVDTGHALVDMIEDCAVCCRPIRLVIRCSGGGVSSLETYAC